MSLICLDTHILIWGLKEESSPNQEEMVPKAKAFLKHLDEKNINSLIPSVVVAELLMAIPPESHTMVINLLQKGFIVPPFDVKASAHFARIWQDRKDKKIIDDLLKNHNAKREELKADCMIIATAISRNASIIYSYDEKLKKFSNGHIEVREMPLIREQKQLFD